MRLAPSSCTTGMGPATSIMLVGTWALPPVSSATTSTATSGLPSPACPPQGQACVAVACRHGRNWMALRSLPLQSCRIQRAARCVPPSLLPCRARCRCCPPVVCLRRPPTRPSARCRQQTCRRRTRRRTLPPQAPKVCRRGSGVVACAQRRARRSQQRRLPHRQWASRRQAPRRWQRRVQEPPRRWGRRWLGPRSSAQRQARRLQRSSRPRPQRHRPRVRRRGSHLHSWSEPRPRQRSRSSRSWRHCRIYCLLMAVHRHHHHRQPELPQYQMQQLCQHPWTQRRLLHQQQWTSQRKLHLLPNLLQAKWRRQLLQHMLLLLLLLPLLQSRQRQAEQLVMVRPAKSQLAQLCPRTLVIQMATRLLLPLQLPLKMPPRHH
mmetsp:Transcript_144115/g.401526  ORF Transcript_144115/g.401526 Transcript_144115/m.401526 type:complete len:377 (-) Transcript_144115:1764-2894(-)